MRATTDGEQLREMRTLVKVALDIRKASEALARSEFLQDLGDIQLSMMASAGKRRRHKRYTAVYREASPATCFYILKGGSLHETALDGTSRTVTVERTPEAEFVLFGMEALLGKPRSATVVAVDDVDVIKFSAVDLNVKEDGASKVARKVFNAFVEGELAHLALFRGIPNAQLKRVVPLFALEEYSANSTIFKQGAPGDKVYIVMHGSINILKGKTLLQTLRAEQGQAASSSTGLPVFGEMALLDRSPRVASAVAISDCKLLVLPHEQFAAASLIVPDIKSRLRKLKEQRKQENAAKAAAKKEAKKDGSAYQKKDAGSASASKEEEEEEEAGEAKSPTGSSPSSPPRTRTPSPPPKQ